MLTTRHLSIVQLIMLLAGASVTGAQSLPNLPQTLEGAWDVTISAQGSILCTAPAVFSRDGNVIADPCSGSQLGAGYGAWLRTGNREFAGTFIGNIYNGSTGDIVGKYKVRSQGTLHSAGDMFTGVFKTESFDLAGNVLTTVTGNLLAKRIQVEVLQ